MSKPRLFAVLAVHLVTFTLATVLTAVLVLAAPPGPLMALLGVVWGVVGLESALGAILMGPAERADLRAVATVFRPDEAFERTLEGLRQHYGLQTQAEVIRRAVALLGIVREHESPDGSITLRRDGQDVVVQVRGDGGTPLRSMLLTSHLDGTALAVGTGGGPCFGPEARLPRNMPQCGGWSHPSRGWRFSGRKACPRLGFAMA